MMTTTNNNTTNTNTAQRKRAQEEEYALAKEKEERQRDCWSNGVHGAIWRHMKRQLLASGGYNATRFVPFYEEDVTRSAAMVEECLDNARAHAKRKGRALPPLEYLPRSVLESEALEPYLSGGENLPPPAPPYSACQCGALRLLFPAAPAWKYDDAAAAAAAAAAPTRARCAYRLMD
jgi:hypothetical protein